MWQGDDFEWHGDLLDVDAPPDRDNHVILPRPVQLPHPPLYLACTKRDTVTLAAEYGIGALVLGFAGIDEVTELVKIYKDAIATRTGDRFVSTVTNDHISALCPTIVLDDGDEALRVGARGTALLRRVHRALVRRWPEAERGHRERGQRRGDRSRTRKSSWHDCTKPRSR